VKEFATYEDYRAKAQTAKTINCLIFVLCENKKNFRVLDQLTNVLSYYSKLGAFSKSYLLEKKMISKFVLFLSDPNQSSPIDVKEFERDLSRQMLEMGQPKTSTQNKIQFRTIDDVLEKKREKNLVDTQTPNFKHLIVMFSNIATSVSLNGEEPASNSGNPFASSETLVAIDKEELEWILNAGIWRKLMNEASSKLARKYTAKFFGFIAFNSEERFKAVLQFLSAEINDKDDIALKAPLITLSLLVEINDQFRQNRVRILLSVLLCCLILIAFIDRSSLSLDISC
jgi:hypothetical protein